MVLGFRVIAFVTTSQWQHWGATQRLCRRVAVGHRGGVALRGALEVGGRLTNNPPWGRAALNRVGPEGPPESPFLCHCPQPGWRGHGPVHGRAALCQWGAAAVILSPSGHSELPLREPCRELGDPCTEASASAAVNRAGVCPRRRRCCCARAHVGHRRARSRA